MPVLVKFLVVLVCLLLFFEGGFWGLTGICKTAARICESCQLEMKPTDINSNRPKQTKPATVTYLKKLSTVSTQTKSNPNPNRNRNPNEIQTQTQTKSKPKPKPNPNENILFSPPPDFFGPVPQQPCATCIRGCHFKKSPS